LIVIIKTIKLINELKVYIVFELLFF